MASAEGIVDVNVCKGGKFSGKRIFVRIIFTLFVRLVAEVLKNEDTAGFQGGNFRLGIGTDSIGRKLDGLAK